MPTDDAKARKACQNCTKAKSKCSPSPSTENGLGACYRCQRLKKECVFEENVRKRGPKPRSRVKQLELKVDSLIGLLTPMGQATSAVPNSHPTTVSSDSCESEHSVTGCPHATATAIVIASTDYVTPADTPDEHSECSDAGEFYDPVDAGILDRTSADSLLNKFRADWISSFPFVVIPDSFDVDILRRRQPFLFLAVMAVMTYETPKCQLALSEAFKQQMASRIISQSHKSLEILQGLLVYAGWYHCFYRPETQQIAVILQLCVAMVYDLGLSKNPGDRRNRMMFCDKVSPERTIAETRAFLGTYYLSVSFAYAWRKRCPLPFTKYTEQCYQHIAEQSKRPTDALIAPLIQLSELICRVNDHFSYDDIDNAEFAGEMMLEMAMKNFQTELERIRDAVPRSLSQNITLQLKYRLVEVWINEASLHSSLWNSAPHSNTTAFPPGRLRALYRSINATKAYFSLMIEVPANSLPHLAFPSWSAWFYLNIVACKLVFLQENDRRGRSHVEGLLQELCQILPDIPEPAYHKSTRAFESDAHTATTGSWDPVSVEREIGVQPLFEKLIEKFKTLLPPGSDGFVKGPKHNNPFVTLGFIQHSILNGFTKRMKAYMEKTGQSSSTVSLAPNAPLNSAVVSFQPTMTTESGLVSDMSQSSLSGSNHFKEQMRVHPVPFTYTWNLPAVNFENIQNPQTMEVQQSVYDDWVWDTMMDDFTMPTF